MNESATADTNPQGSQNPLLQRIQLPGETFTLPSGGLFYNDGEILDQSVINAEVRVHPMTAIDEICIKTPDMLFSGDAVRQVFKRCIPQVVNVNKMLSKDVDFLLVALRKVSYGDMLDVEYTHDCDKAEKHTYQLNINEFISKTKRIDPTSMSTVFTITLENHQEVHIQPITFADFVKVMQLANSDDDDVNPEKLKDIMIDSLTNIIVSVDEISDKSMIQEWLNKVPPKFIKAINKQIQNTVEWGTEYTTKTKCKDCHTEMEISAPLNPLAFFT